MVRKSLLNSSKFGAMKIKTLNKFNMDGIYPKNPKSPIEIKNEHSDILSTGVLFPLDRSVDFEVYLTPIFYENNVDDLHYQSHKGYLNSVKAADEILDKQEEDFITLNIGLKLIKEVVEYQFAIPKTSVSRNMAFTIYTMIFGMLLIQFLNSLNMKFFHKELSDLEAHDQSEQPPKYSIIEGSMHRVARS